MRRVLAGMAIAFALGGQVAPKVEEKPATPQRIRVRCGVQAAFPGAGPRWRVTGHALSDRQITELEAAVSENPEDVCTRGYLIAFGEDRLRRRLEHVLWMINHRPDWEGFLRNLSATRLTREGQGQVRTAWLGATGARTANGMVLHYAALFFEATEPYLAEELLRRAIRLEPDEPFHREELGALYARSVRSSYASQAVAMLASTRDPVVLAGALNALQSFREFDLAMQLSRRLGDRAGEMIRDLPSRTGRYGRSQCPDLALEIKRECIEPAR